jgi:acyl-CoA thioester hydrolase
MRAANHDIPVRWGDQDAFGHVNNSVIARYVEDARVHFLADAGMDMRPGVPHGPILADLHLAFRHPLFFPDTVHVATRAAHLGTTSVTLEHTLLNDAGTLIASATDIIVYYVYTAARKEPIPDGIRQRLAVE